MGATPLRYPLRSPKSRERNRAGHQRLWLCPASCAVVSPAFLGLSLLSDGFVGAGVAEIVAATSSARPWADVAYCIHALARRLAKTRN